MSIEEIQQKHQQQVQQRKQYEQGLYDTYEGSIKRYNELHDQQKELIAKLPNYWLYVIQNSDWSQELPLTKTDYLVLKHLKDI